MLKCLKYFLFTFPPVFVLIMVSFFFVDKSFAVTVHGLFPKKEVIDNAQFGTYLTCCAYLCMLPVFAIYYILRVEGFNKLVFMNFIRQLSLSVVLGYFIKDCLKFFFGRTTALDYATGKLSFLIHPGRYGFHFFSLGEDSFPSGHMTMICVGMVSLLLFYPKLKIPAILMILLMFTSLLLYNFHFLSDTIAGTYLGTTIALGVYYLNIYKTENHYL